MAVDLAASPARRASDLGLLLVAVGAVAFGLRPLFARWAFAGGISPEVASLLTLVPTALICLPWTLAALVGPRRTRPAAPALWALLAGILVALGSIAYMRALDGLAVATASLIYFSYPLFVLLLGWAFMGLTLGARSLGAVGLILAGGAAALSPSGLAGGEAVLIALCFAAPLSYALLVLLLARRLMGLPLIARMGLITLGASLVLVPAALASPSVAVPDLSMQGWSGVVGLIVVCGFVPQLTTTIGIPIAGAERSAIAGVLELVTALAVGWLLLGETAALLEIAGAAMILAAVLLVRGGSGG